MFIYTFFVFYNLYIYNVRLTIYHDIYCVTTHFSPFCCCCPFYFLFFIMKKYICPKRSSVIYLSCYRVSISPLQAVNCIPWAVKICLFLSNLYHRCLCHTYVNACLGCVFIYWEYINHFMYRSVSGLFTTHNNWPKGFSQWYLQKSIVKVATQQWWNGREKKRAICFFFSSFLFFWSLAL